MWLCEQVVAHVEQERFGERLDRCDAAAASCEQLTKEMENHLRQAPQHQAESYLWFKESHHTGTHLPIRFG